jgi:hypothetical protein
VSKKQSSGDSPVSLFPFLAVLMCTMGALILLLIVISRRVREQALHAARSPVAVVQAPTAPPPLPPLEPAAEKPIAILDPRDNVPLMPELAIDPGESLAEYRRREAALNREWTDRAA